MRVVLQIRAQPERRVRRNGRPNRRLAHVGAALILPLALFCFFICAWRWSYDLSWTGHFPLMDGILSRWQVWFFAGTVLQALAVRLARYAEPERRRERPIAAPQDSRQAQIP